MRQKIDAREQTDSETTDNPADNHSPEADGEGLDSTAHGEYDGTCEESTSAANCVTDSSRSNGCNCFTMVSQRALRERVQNFDHILKAPISRTATTVPVSMGPG